MEAIQLFTTILLVLIIYLVLAFSYHVYKLEILIRQFLGDIVDFDATLKELEHVNFSMKKRCKKCNRNDNTCGCN